MGSELLKVLEIDTTSLDTGVRLSIQAALDVEVQDAASYELAATNIKHTKAFLKEYGVVFDPLRDALHKSHKDVVAAKKEKLKPIEDAIAAVKKKMNAYDAEQQRIQREAQAKLEREAKEKAEKEALDAALAAEAAGKEDEVEAIMEAPVIPEPVVAPPATPKVAGVQRRTTWTYTIIDPNKIPRQFLIVDEKKIRQHVNTHKGNAEAGGPMVISGVSVYSENKVAI